MANKPEERIDTTGIAWTDATWNPLRARNRETGDVGWVCVRVSDGCKHCYAATQNKVRRWNRGTGLDYTVPDLARVETFVDEKTLALPLGWREPRRVFVCSMTDLFGEWVSDEEIDRIFAVMALTPQHTYQVLTKRPERMSDYVASRLPKHAVHSIGFYMHQFQPSLGDRFPFIWPLRNVWAGASTENQEAFDERWPYLRDTPAAVRFISYEPALGPLDASSALLCETCGHPQTWHSWGGYCKGELECYCVMMREVGLDWVIVGGESGTPHRDMNIEWPMSIYEQCTKAGVPLFMKQDSGSKPGQQGRIPDNIWIREWPMP